MCLITLGLGSARVQYDSHNDEMWAKRLEARPWRLCEIIALRGSLHDIDDMLDQLLSSWESADDLFSQSQQTRALDASVDAKHRGLGGGL